MYFLYLLSLHKPPNLTADMTYQGWLCVWKTTMQLLVAHTYFNMFCYNQGHSELHMHTFKCFVKLGPRSQWTAHAYLQMFCYVGTKVTVNCTRIPSNVLLRGDQGHSELHTHTFKRFVPWGPRSQWTAHAYLQTFCYVGTKVTVNCTRIPSNVLLRGDQCYSELHTHTFALVWNSSCSISRSSAVSSEVPRSTLLWRNFSAESFSQEQIWQWIIGMEY